MPKLAIPMDPTPIDLRTCPLWAIPQLAELRRRITHYGGSIVAFESTSELPFQRETMGEFVIQIPGEGFYYGYFFSKHMNNYRHPTLHRFF